MQEEHEKDRKRGCGWRRREVGREGIGRMDEWGKEM